MDLGKIQADVRQVAHELLDPLDLEGKIVVLGGSSSEICGKYIGKGSSAETGQAVIEALLPIVQEKKAYLAVQCCEHLNRALVLEREAAEKYGFTIVTVVPAPHAGGAHAVAAYKSAKDPVLVEHIVADAGIDIGDTFIGMHVKHVQIPVRTSIKEIGEAHVTCLKNRPKLIGGPRAQYEEM
ncbi:TIGR01440 family protein [Ruminococcaceae bacterium OttesenSCG-928-I18]|nr:TIGR01440 family protein [Ruminococcaceae bacterium OttesenSCG-928-I18]